MKKKYLDIFHGKQLRTLRKSKKLKQFALIEALSLESQQQLSDLENGKRHFSDQLIKKICLFFKVSTNYFSFVEKKFDYPYVHLTKEYASFLESDKLEDQLQIYKRLFLMSALENIELILKFNFNITKTEVFKKVPSSNIYVLC